MVSTVAPRTQPRIVSPNDTLSPSPQTPPPQTPPPPDPSTYTMQRGDTLGALARANNISLDELLQANPSIRDPRKIAIGQQIHIPASAEPEPRAVPTEGAREVASSRLGGVDSRTITVPTTGATTTTARPTTPGVIDPRDLPTTGASARTARQDRAPAGVEGSRQMARNDEARVARYREAFQEVGARHNIDPSILAAIASRESRGGSALDRNGRGDNGNGHGLMQVDRRYHRPQGGPFSEAHINQAAGILAGFRDDLRARFPTWTDAQVMTAAISAYNRGTARITSPETADRGTTGRDYGNDVIARAQYYRERGF